MYYPSDTQGFGFGQANTPVVSATNITVSGAPIVDRVPQPPVVAPLPMDGTMRLASPVTIADNGSTLTLFGGDVDTDAVSLPTGFNARPLIVDNATANIQIPSPARGSFNVNDFVLLVDFLNQRSVFCQIANASASTLTLSRVTYLSRAWTRIWSNPVDADYVFPSGSSLIKIAPLKIWQFSAPALLRREGFDVAVVVDLGMTEFTASSVTLSGNNNNYSYQVVMQFISEGTDTTTNQSDAATQPVTLVLSPRDLNNAYLR